MDVKDSSGNILCDGDAVKPNKDLKVKGSSMVIKRGTVIKKIKIIEDNEKEIECRVDGVELKLEVRWLQKV
ncbi:alkylphosphonate utilization protein [Fluviispira sanaruensis]|uniref:PhnA-like phosphonoacetate hydrolase n=1 Tax=Fluviispira sanaruensis TaxID=2493639 RepID=A0A4P2VNM8_FLUSA|nr:alkylphosphonate utilization protein [Fluviispira sanaruensis]BBH53764.1 PhnA-like phosphonoacetate hydrolase [Fluviispira sanaruensis]